MIHSIPTMASTSKMTRVPEPIILKRKPTSQSVSLFELLPDIVDSSVDYPGEAVDLCVAQIENGLAKADDIPNVIV